MEKLIQILKALPKWARAVVIALLFIAAGIATFYVVPSCSSVKTVSYGDGRISTSVTQSGVDSVSVSVNLNKR